MIIDIFLNIIYSFIWLITLPLRTLPDINMASDFGNAITTAGGYIAPLNNIIPVDTILIILSISVSIELAYLLYRFIMWLIKRLPTQS